MSDRPNNDRGPLLFGLLDQMSVGGGGAATLWTHPEDQRVGANTLEYWSNIARIADQSNFDLMFLGDVLGLYDTYGGNHEAALRWAIEAPANDPAVLVPALAALTKNLAFTITSSTSYEDPFSLARRFSTLDHISGGRLGWNVVTSYLTSAARNFGLSDMMEHDARYARADEFLEVVYKLWEGSWADDAVIADKPNTTYARGERVRPINHHGTNFRVAGPHVNSPSPQRTPVLFQAGSSPRGSIFGAKHAEVIFTGDTDPHIVRSKHEHVAQLAKENGRPAGSVAAMTGFSTIVGRTEAEAYEKLDRLHKSYHIDGMLVNYAGTIGVNLNGLKEDEPIAKGHGAASYVLRSDGTPLTLRHLRERMEKVAPRREAVFIGTPEQIADKLDEHARTSGARAYMLLQLIAPGTLEDFVTLVVPELIKRGLFRDTPPTGTLRSRFRLDGTDRLPSHAYGASFRFPESVEKVS